MLLIICQFHNFITHVTDVTDVTGVTRPDVLQGLLSLTLHYRHMEGIW